VLEQRSRDFILNLEVPDRTLHYPSISMPAKTGMRLWAFLVPPNQRHAHPCYSKQTIAHIPKLDVAGSSPVSRSILSIIYRHSSQTKNRTNKVTR
jgi:hypothetical protein